LISPAPSLLWFGEMHPMTTSSRGLSYLSLAVCLPVRNIRNARLIMNCWYGLHHSFLSAVTWLFVEVLGDVRNWSRS
jgi:hypothetical protein